ncbi:MAG: GTPase domain-containing protein [Deltaproteobacteria bacterium]|nr:GTPase domain-containing protein [Deltaproteobacteria bacterium]
MPFINLFAREINCKVVYYGPGLGGKTTNIEVLNERVKPEARGQLLKLNTETERTLFYDFVPIDLAEVRGFKTRFLLYTTPGQVYYHATRKLVLKGVDGIVFVADSQLARADANELALEEMKEDLAEYGVDLADLPFVIQYNKRDLTQVTPIEELRRTLNPTGVPEFEAVASQGVGVSETFKAVARGVITKLRDQQGGGAPAPSGLGH